MFGLRVGFLNPILLSYGEAVEMIGYTMQCIYDPKLQMVAGI